MIIIKSPKTEMADNRKKKRREEKRKDTKSHFARFSKSASLFIEFPFLMFIRFSPILYTKMHSRPHSIENKVENIKRIRLTTTTITQITNDTRLNWFMNITI